MNGLTYKQKRFVNEYLVDLNAKQAAIRAGYSKKTAKQQASRLLGHAKIKEYVELEQIKIQERTKTTVAWVVEEIKNSYERCSQKILLHDNEHNSKGIWRFDAVGAIRCLELLGKHLGMFKGKVNGR